jgi:hypothetical protein
VDKAVELTGEHLSAFAGVFINEQSRLHPRLPRGIVGNLISVSLHPLAPVFGQVKALRGLKRKVFVIGFVELLGISSSSTAMASGTTFQP